MKIRLAWRREGGEKGRRRGGILLCNGLISQFLTLPKLNIFKNNILTVIFIESSKNDIIFEFLFSNDGEN